MRKIEPGFISGESLCHLTARCAFNSQKCEKKLKGEFLENKNWTRKKFHRVKYITFIFFPLRLQTLLQTSDRHLTTITKVVNDTGKICRIIL